MKERIHGLLICNFLLLFSACSYNEIKQGGQRPLGKPGQATTITFEEVRSRIYNNPQTGRCTNCHDWANTYVGVASRLADTLDRIKREPGTAGFMPRNNAPLSQELKDLLQEWADGGAPEFAGDTPPGSAEPSPSPPPLEDLELNFEVVSTYVFGPYCVQCHSSFREYRKVAKEIRDIREEVSSGNMPQRGSLPQYERDLLFKWIDNGFPE